MSDNNIEIPYLEFVLYNQTQAKELGLSYTESILMHYFAYILPTWWESQIINDKKCHWLSYWKLFDEMPTLDFKEMTLRRHINKFIKEGLLTREIVGPKNSARAFYRVEKKYFVKEKTRGLNFDRVYDNINSLLEEGRMLSPEKNKLEKLLSSYKGKSIANKTTYNFNGICWTPILDYLQEEFKLSEKWEWVWINIGKEINEEFVLDLLAKIVKKGELKWWIPKNLNGEHEVTEQIKWKILSKLQDLFHYNKQKNRVIKDFTGQINTWFGRDYI